MANKPISQNVTISSEDGAYRLKVNSDGSIPVSGTGSGAAVTIADGADVALGSTTDNAYVGTEPYSAMSALRAIADAAISTNATPTNLTQTGGVALAADDAPAGSAPPVPIGGIYSATLPAGLADGDRGMFRTTQGGVLLASIAGALGAGSDTGGNASVVFPTTATAGGQTNTARTGLAVVQHTFDGTQWIRTRSNTVANGGALLTESGPYSLGRVTADGQVKGSAGFIHTITISPLTATPAAGLVTIYNSLTETGTVVYAEWIFATTVGHTVTLDVPCSTGIYVGYDGTLANVQVTISYR